MDRTSIIASNHDETPLSRDKASRSIDVSKPLVCAVMILAAACAPATVSSGEQVTLSSWVIAADVSTAAALSHSSASHLRRMDFISVQGTSVADAVTQLRPEWLRSNPSSAQAGEFVRPSIYVDKTYVGGPEELRFVPLDAAMDLQFLAPSAASDQFGPGCRCTGGVIVVLTRRVR